MTDERRSTDRRASDRRVASRRAADRRVGSRRSGVDRRDETVVSTQTGPVLAFGGLDHVVIRCRDIGRMIAFYRDVLGCPVERTLPEARLTQLRAGAALIDLVDAADSPPAEGAARNMDHFCLSLTRFDAAAIQAHLDSHKVAAQAPKRRYGAEGFGPSIYLTDPEGNTVELKGPPEAG